MKFVSLILAVFFCGCATVKKEDPFQTSATNLTEAEIRALPRGITFKAIDQRLRYFTRSAVAVPIISFEIEGRNGYTCMMTFDDSGTLLYAWSAPERASATEDAVILWPHELADRKLSEIENMFGKKEANQKVTQPTPSGAADR